MKEFGFELDAFRLELLNFGHLVLTVTGTRFFLFLFRLHVPLRSARTFSPCKGLTQMRPGFLSADTCISIFFFLIWS